MSWTNRFFDPRSWFYWTVLAKGMRDGAAGFPKENDCHSMEVNNGDIAAVIALLERLHNGSARAKNDSAGKANASSATDDYEKIIAMLRSFLKERGAHTEALDRNTLILLSQALTDVVVLLQHKPDAENPHRGNRLSFYEAEIIDIAEEEITSLLGEKWERKKDALEASAKKIQHHLLALHEEYNEFNRQHKSKDLKRPLRMIPKWLYVPMMVFIGVVEFGFNLQAFNILRMDMEETYLIAAGPSLVIPFLAHVLGTKIRQWPKKEDMSWRVILIVSIASICLLVALVAIGLLRADYIAYITKSAANLQQAYYLMGINLLFLAGAMVAAYIAHDPDRDLERIYDHKRRQRKMINKKWDAWNKVAAKYDMLRGQTLGKIQGIREEAIAKLDEYRRGNACSRADGNIPSHFQDSISDRFFKPRNLGSELDYAPASLDDVLNGIKKDNLTTNSTD